MESKSATHRKCFTETWSLKICWLLQMKNFWKSQISALQDLMESLLKILLMKLWLSGTEALISWWGQRTTQPKLTFGLSAASSLKWLTTVRFLLDLMKKTSYLRFSKQWALLILRSGQKWRHWPFTSQECKDIQELALRSYVQLLMSKVLICWVKCSNVTLRSVFQLRKLWSTRTLTMCQKR